MILSVNISEEKIISKLTQMGASVATAESCTGGMIASKLVNVPGASACFNEGYVTYSNEAKNKNLGVSNDTLSLYGAVSRQTAVEMSTGVRQRAQATYGIATTGIAGPDGGTDEKPVGTVYISVASPKSVITRKYVFSGNRWLVRSKATRKAFCLLWEMIKTGN